MTPSRVQFASPFMLTGSRLDTMLGVVRRAAPIEARAAGEAKLGGEAVLRRLAAMLAADVAGYARLIEADEQGTLARLRNPRRTPKTTGDGMLMEFGNAIEAAPIVAR